MHSNDQFIIRMSNVQVSFMKIVNTKFALKYFLAISGNSDLIQWSADAVS